MGTGVKLKNKHMYIVGVLKSADYQVKVGIFKDLPGIKHLINIVASALQYQEI